VWPTGRAVASLPGCGVGPAASALAGSGICPGAGPGLRHGVREAVRVRGGGGMRVWFVGSFRCVRVAGGAGAGGLRWLRGEVG